MLWHGACLWAKQGTHNNALGNATAAETPRRRVGEAERKTAASRRFSGKAALHVIREVVRCRTHFIRCKKSRTPLWRLMLRRGVFHIPRRQES